LNFELIAAVCDCEWVEDGFVAALTELGFRPPDSVVVPNSLLDQIVDRLNLTIRTECLRLEVGRRALVSSVLQPILDQCDQLLCFQEEACSSSLLLKKGPVDFLVATCALPVFRQARVKVFVVECKKLIDEFSSHFPLWLGEMSAVMNGGDYSQGALTDGCRWMFATLTRDDPSKSTTSAVLPIAKPKLTVSLSAPIDVIGSARQVDVANLRLVCQFLQVCFNDGCQKMAASRLFVPLPFSDEIGEAASLAVAMLLETEPEAVSATAAVASSSSAPLHGP
jgi:hypothetical protein